MRIEEWALERPFRTAAIERRSVRVLVVEITDGSIRGRGESFAHEAVGVSVEEAFARAQSAPLHHDRERLCGELPPGPARDALDQALWDFEAKRRGRRVWELLGLEVAPVATAYTVGIDAPDAMRAQAAARADWPLLKLKASAENCLEQVDAVRAGAPSARLIVDGNAAWSIDAYRTLSPLLVERGVVLLEQPLAPKDDHALVGARPVPICADESLGAMDDPRALVDRYDAVNVKLPKAGGLTAALTLIQAAREAKLRVLVGCMVSTSLAIAPAWIAAQYAAYADLDGPLLLGRDRTPGLTYDRWKIEAPPTALWG
ncbi:MAG: enolase C-terminal domain-like protein [Myxococcota bacterium]